MSRKVLTSPYIVWGAAFIILPLFMVIYYGCTGSDGSFTLSNITAMADPVHYKAFWNSVWIAMASTMICLVISYPLAYIFVPLLENTMLSEDTPLGTRMVFPLESNTGSPSEVARIVFPFES